MYGGGTRELDVRRVYSSIRLIICREILVHGHDCHVPAIYSISYISLCSCYCRRGRLYEFDALDTVKNFVLAQDIYQRKGSEPLTASPVHDLYVVQRQFVKREVLQGGAHLHLVHFTI